MKIKQSVTFEQLINFGFAIETDEDDWEINCKWCYNLGHSRRGQFYYYIIKDIDNDRELLVYASKPDGDGTHIALGDVIIKMYEEGLIEI